MILSTVFMWSIFEPGTDPSRVYFGTDTRVAGLLLGAAGAVIWHPGRVIARRHRSALAAGGVVGLLGILWAYSSIDEYSDMLYRGGFLLVAALSLALTLAAADRHGPLGLLLAMAPLRWLGTRSYSIYLWHWPVMVFLRPGMELPFDGTLALAIQLLVVGLLAECSYRWVESRWRRPTPRTRHKTGESREKGRHRQERRPSDVPRRSAPLAVRAMAVLGVLTILLAVVVAVGSFHVLTTDRSPAPLVGAALDVAGLERGQATTTTTDAPDLKRVDDARSGDTDQAAPFGAAQIDASQLPDGVSIPAAVHATGTSSEAPILPPVTALGDSVMLGAAEELAQAYPGEMDVDAIEGRTVPDGVELLVERAERGWLGELVVVHLGSNGPLYADQITRIMHAVDSDRHVIFVNVQVPRRWEGPVNQALSSEVAKYSNASLVDWHSQSAGRHEWFQPDGVHIVNRPGADA
jgi:peptidoglycan/LPS O-acetylase OafA/YrhL